METSDMTRKKTTSCGGVVWRVRDGRYELLLVKQFANSNRWGVPKGHQHEGESLEQTAKREIREEAGVEVELSERLQDTFIAYGDEDKTVCVWLAHVVGNDEPRHDDPDSEVADARWFPIDSLPDIMVYQRPLIASAVNVLLAPSNTD
jgi:8-oxo-dGTP pyrophosphatase MutT (NUDIX family)